MQKQKGWLPYHVESDYRDFSLFVIRCHGISNHASRRTRQNGLETSKLVDIDEATIALHKLASGAPGSLLMLDALRAQASFKAGLEAVYILSNGRSQVGIRTNRRCSRHQLDHGHQFVAQRDVLEANVLCNPAYQGFVLGECVSVHETDGYTANSRIVHLLQLLPDVVVLRAS